MDISLWQFIVGATAWTCLLAIVMWCGFHYTAGDEAERGADYCPACGGCCRYEGPDDEGGEP